TFTRLEAGGLAVERETIALDDIVEEVRAVIEPLAGQKGLEFTVHQPDAPVSLVTDVRKFRQILLNLLGNAVKFTETGGVQLEIERRGGSLELCVVDSGVGIAPEHLTKIFEPFWQAEWSRKRSLGGTGLGLAISQRLAALIGGRLTASSE